MDGQTRPATSYPLDGVHGPHIIMWQPAVLRPEPEPWFVTELKLIDPQLRVVFGFERYLRKRWTIERKIEPDRYVKMYASILESGEPRFVEQPIYDTEQPEFNALGEQVGFKIIGHRQFDLCPNWEWIMFVENKDGSYRELARDVITELKRVYAWERFHSLTRAKMEKEAEHAKIEAEQKQQRVDEAMDALPQVWRETGKTLFGGQPKKAMKGTEL